MSTPRATARIVKFPFIDKSENKLKHFLFLADKVTST